MNVEPAGARLRQRNDWTPPAAESLPTGAGMIAAQLAPLAGTPASVESNPLPARAARPLPFRVACGHLRASLSGPDQSRASWRLEFPGTRRATRHMRRGGSPRT